MDRRQCLSGAGAVLTAVFGGCLDSGTANSELSVECSEATLDPDTGLALTAHARNVDQFSFDPPSSDHLEVVSVDVSPSPDVQEDSFPPIWYWDTPQSSVEAVMEIHVSEGTPVGEYSYEIAGSRRDERVTEECTITIRSGSD